MSSPDEYSNGTTAALYFKRFQIITRRNRLTKIFTQFYHQRLSISYIKSSVKITYDWVVSNFVCEFQVQVSNQGRESLAAIRSLLDRFTSRPRVIYKKLFYLWRSRLAGCASTRNQLKRYYDFIAIVFMSMQKTQIAKAMHHARDTIYMSV